MRTPALHLATLADLPAPETAAQRIRNLQAESKRLAMDEARSLAADLLALHARASEIHAGGDAFSAGVRQVAREVMQDAETRGATLAAILGRSS